MDYKFEIWTVSVSIIIVIGQIWFNLRQQKLDATFKVIELFHQESNRLARFKLSEMSKEIDIGKEYNNLCAEKRAMISGVSSIFGLIGILIRHNRVDEEIVFEAMGLSILQNYDRLKGYLESRADRRRSNARSLAGDFEYLAKRARNYDPILRDFAVDFAKQPLEPVEVTTSLSNPS